MDATSTRVIRLVVVLSALLILPLWAPVAGAAAPLRQGWWTMTNLSRVDTPGGPLPGAETPPPPDVPTDGLLVQGGPDDSSDLPGAIGGPSAFAALLYDVPTGDAADTLVLRLAEDATSTSLAPLRACPLVGTFQPAQGGPMSDAPAFDCTADVVAEPTADGTRYEWPVAALESNGVVAVAILAVGSNDRVVFSAPDDGSLVTVPAGDARVPATTAAVPEGAAPAAPPLRFPSRFPRRASSAMPAAPAAELAAPAPVVTSATPDFEPTSVLAEEFELAAAIVLVLVLAVGAALWVLAGRDDPEDEDPTRSLALAPT